MNRQPIPGSFLDPQVERLQWRLDRSFVYPRQGEVFATEPRRYLAEVHDGTLCAIVSQNQGDGLPFWHLSVSHRGRLVGPDGGKNLFRLPNWDEIKHAKYRLVPIDVPMAIILPSRTADYVDLHPTTIHARQCHERLEF